MVLFRKIRKKKWSVEQKYKEREWSKRPHKEKNRIKSEWGERVNWDVFSLVVLHNVMLLLSCFPAKKGRMNYYYLNEQDSRLNVQDILLSLLVLILHLLLSPLFLPYFPSSYTLNSFSDRKISERKSLGLRGILFYGCTFKVLIHT